jgi:hypothetical protein
MRESALGDVRDGLHNSPKCSLWGVAYGTLDN